MSKVDRAKAIRYLQDKYGKDYVCQIITFGQFKIRNTIKAVLSADRGFTADYQNSITKQIPSAISNGDVTWELIEGFHKDPDNPKYDDLTEKEKSQLRTSYKVLTEVFQKYPEVYDAVNKICGAISSIGLHAGGVCVSSKKIGDYVPLVKGSDTAVLHCCQCDMTGVTFFNLLKIDVLGLKTLSEMKLCMDMLNLGIDWLNDEDVYDKKVYEFLREGNTANIFQMAKFAPTKMIKDFKVNSLEELTAVNAGNRPGPQTKQADGLSMVDRYVEAVKTGQVEKMNPVVDKILENTKGCLWYQEHCIKLGTDMAGYSLGNADLRIRKVIAKFLGDLTQRLRES